MLSKLKNTILNFRNKYPKAYFFSWIFLVFIILYFFNSSIYGFIFFGSLITFSILKISYKVSAILALIFLGLCPIFLIFKNEILAEFFGIYAYLFLWCTILVQIKLFLREQKRKSDNRFSLKIFKNFNWKNFSIVFIVFLALIFWKNIFMTRGNVQIGDLAFSINKNNTLPNLFTWYDLNSISNTANPQIFFFTIISFPFRVLNLSSEWIIKIIFLEAILISVFSTYYLSKIFFKRFISKNKSIILELAVIVSVLFYILNPYALNRIFHFYHWIPYCFLPLIFLIFLKFLETKKIHFIIILAFLLSFISFSPHFLVYAFIVMGLFSIVSLAKWIGKIGFVTDKKRSIREGFKVILGGIVFVLCFTLFSAHWLIPYLKNSLMQGSAQAPGYMLTKEYIEPASEGLKNKIKEVFQTLALNPDTTDSKILNFFLKIFTYLLPFLLFLPLFKGLRNKHIIFFSILGILAGTASVLPILNYTLYQKILFDIPYLNNFNWLFREAYRINGLLAFAYSFLLGFLFLKLLQIKFNRVKLFCLIMLGLVIFWGGMIKWIF